MRKIVSVLVLLVLAVGLLLSGTLLNFGNPAAEEMDAYMLANGQVQTGGNNIVTDVVFDYRGFDTLGEATVLFTAVLGVGLVFRRMRNKKEEEYEYE
jgi:multisubunit Na+/H+ antiporter MnhB subunit